MSLPSREATDWLRSGRALAGALGAGLALVAWLVAAARGAEAAAAVLAGCLVGGAAHVWLASSLASLMGEPQAAERARARAALGLLVRQGVLGAVLWVLVVELALPAGWLLAGITAWPVALAATALARHGSTGVARPPLRRPAAHDAPSLPRRAASTSTDV